MYRAICGKALVLCELDEKARFTCGGDRRGHRGESAFSGTFAAEALPQVYRVICGKALTLCQLGEVSRFTCGGDRRGTVVRVRSRAHWQPKCFRRCTA